MLLNITSELIPQFIRAFLIARLLKGIRRIEICVCIVIAATVFNRYLPF